MIGMMEKQTFAKAQAAFSLFGNISDVEKLQDALTRIPLYASLEIVAETCVEVGVLQSVRQWEFSPKLSLSQFYEVAVALDKKLLGAVTSVASVEEARELLEELGLSTVQLCDDQMGLDPSPDSDHEDLRVTQRVVTSSNLDAASNSESMRSPMSPGVQLAEQSRRRSAGAIAHSAASSLPVVAVPSVWLSPNPSQKGRGPRSSIYLHDIPPTNSALNEHVSRLAERTRLLNKNDAISPDRPKPRTVGEMLRLPQLTAEELEAIEAKSMASRIELEAEDSRWSCDSRAVTPMVKGPTAEQQLTSAIHNDIIRTNHCNAVIEHTYRRARDVGISTGSCMNLIQRGIVKKVKQKEMDRLEAKKRKLRERFVM